MKKLFITVIFVLVAFNSLYGKELDSWKDQVLYFVLIDRFYDGNRDNCKNVDKKNLLAFHGGDIAGLEQKLDYLNELGITGIWVSPFLQNREDAFYGQEAYHGYWPYDFFSVDKRFGTEEELVSFRNKLKKMNMRLVLDMVVNHMGYDAPFVDEHKDWFNPMINIENWNDPVELKERCIFGLPDFASQKKEVRDFFGKVSEHWINILHPEAFRLDAVKHVNDEFWSDFNSNARKLSDNGFMILGEYLHGDPAEVKKTWENAGFDSLFDFPLYYTMKEVFAQDGNCKKLASRLYFDRYYPDAWMLATLLDNHDLDRFITSCKGNIDRYKLAMAFLMTVRGIPTLCYGDEQPLRGYHGSLPHNRCDMKFTTRSDMFKFTRELIALRKNNIALRRGLHCHLYADKNLYAFCRLTEDQLAIVVFNNSDEQQKLDVDFPFDIQNSVYVQDPVCGDANARATITCGKLKTTLAAKSFAVYIPNSISHFYSKPYNDWKNRFEDEMAWGERPVTIKLIFEKAPSKADFFVTGNCDELGNWNIEKSVKMRHIAGNNYEATVNMPVGKIFEYKGFYRQGKKTVWQNGENNIDIVRK